MTWPATEFTRELARSIPELEPLLRDHEARNFGDLLPHVFFGDVTRFVMELHNDAEAGSLAAERTLGAILTALEDGMRGSDDDITELIGASFLDNLERSDAAFGAIRMRLGKELRAALDDPDQWYAEWREKWGRGDAHP